MVEGPTPVSYTHLDVYKRQARAKPEGVNITPTTYFKDSPTWTPDQATEGYIKTCQGTKAGDPINPAYVDRILTAALISEAINAYNDRQYQKALELYQSALRSPGGQQLRVYNGLYLASWKLGRRDDATDAFGKIVDLSLIHIFFCRSPPVIACLTFTAPSMRCCRLIWRRSCGWTPAISAC